MKLEKEKLARLTESALHVAGTAMALLVTNRCPVRREYEEVENFVAKVEEVRDALGLPPLTSLGFTNEKTRREPIGFKYN